MDLSLKVLEVCKNKFGKGNFYGFDFDNKDLLVNTSEEEFRKTFEALADNKLIENTDEGVHFTELAHHFFNMMINPEQVVIINNHVSNMVTRVYFRNTYYLYIMENKEDESIKLELMPMLDQVVGAFVYALNLKDKTTDQQNENDFEIEGKSWKEDREVVSELIINGKYLPEKVFYQISLTKGDNNKKEEREEELSNLVNEITYWLLNSISDQYKREENKPD